MITPSLADIDLALEQRRIGPVYLVDDVISILETSSEFVYRKTRTHELISFRTADGYAVYPAWQFDVDSNICPQIKIIYDIIFAHHGSHEEAEVSAARWLGSYEYGTVDGRTGDHRRIAVLRCEPERVVDLAFNDFPLIWSDNG